MESLGSYLDWALRQVKAMRSVSLRFFGGNLATRMKKDGTPVTLIDGRCEQMFRKAVAAKFPKHGVLGEEFGESPAHSAWMWVVDPIDGTRAYSRGLPTWGALVTLLYQGEPVLALADYPVFDTLLWAMKDKGAWQGFPGTRELRRLRVSRTVDFSRAVVLHPGFHTFEGNAAESVIRQILRECYLERSYGDCYAYWQLLRGSADLVFDFTVKVWDLAPFVLMAEEAGGELRDLSGRRRWEGPEAVCANPKLVGEVISRLKVPANGTVKK